MKIVEEKVFSQNGEDGILASIFAEIGTGGKYFVEIGCEDGTECNTRLLLENQGWRGIRLDAAYESESRVIFRHFVDAETVCGILEGHGVPKEFDLLSVDIDSNDFHVLNAILSQYRPRVVIVEYNASLGADRDLVIPYDPSGTWDGTDYFGASIGAYAALAVFHKYTLLYCDSCGVNAFLVRSEEISTHQRNVREIYVPPKYGASGAGHPKDPQNRQYLSSEHYLVPGTATANTLYGRITYFANDVYVGRTFAAGSYWEESEINNIAEWLRNRSGLALDIGAHIGSHSIAMAALNQQLQFLCFEPQRPLFLLLERNIFENKLELRLQARNWAVGHRHMHCNLSPLVVDEKTGEQFSISYGGSDLVNLGGVQIGQEGATTEMVKIDDLYPRDVVYIKIDVEGAEAVAFHGMRHTISRDQPIIFFEDREDRRLPDNVMDMLAVPSEIRSFSPTRLLETLNYEIKPLGLDYLAISAGAKQDWPRNDALPVPSVTGDRLTKLTRVPAKHRHWESFLLLSNADNKVAHEENKSLGTYTLSSGVLRVSWNDYPEDIFVDIGGIYTELHMVTAKIKTDSGSQIPPSIFQTWKSKSVFPSNFLIWKESFISLNPSFKYVIWDDDDNRTMIEQEFPWFLALYNSYPREIYRADAIRYFYLYLHGGIYADMDVECLRSLEGMLAEGDVVLGRMGHNSALPHSIPNAIMLSKPREEFWLLVIWLMIHVEDRTQSPEYVTGPVVLKSALDLYQAQDPLFIRMAISSIAANLPDRLKPRAGRSNVAVLSPSRLFAVDWTDPLHEIFRRRVLGGQLPTADEKQSLFPGAWMTTYWSHSW